MATTHPQSSTPSNTAIDLEIGPPNPIKPRLWLAPGTCSLAPHVCALEANLDFDRIMIDIISGGGFPAKYSHLNPKKRIPILEYQGEIITETTAIMTFISLQVPQAKLFGETDMDAVKVYEWLNWLSGTVHECGFGSFFRTTWWYDGEDPDQRIHRTIQGKAAAHLRICFGIIEEKIGEGREHGVRDVFTAADVFLWVVYRWGTLIGWDMEGDYPNWTRLVGKVTKRESVRKAVEIEGIPMVKDDRLKGTKLEGLVAEAEKV